MTILTVLIPLSLFFGLLGLAAFVWALRKGQFEDPKGDGQRILTSDYDDRPKE